VEKPDLRDAQELSKTELIKGIGVKRREKSRKGTEDLLIHSNRTGKVFRRWRSGGSKRREEKKEYPRKTYQKIFPFQIRTWGKRLALIGKKSIPLRRSYLESIKEQFSPRQMGEKKKREQGDPARKAKHAGGSVGESAEN